MNEIRKCKNCSADFVIEPDDFGFYEKIKVPPPKFCFSCRLQRRLSWRNERNFYRRQCGLCSKSIISVYGPENKFPVYCIKCWWGDGWDPYSYGMDYDPNKSFLGQFRELTNKIPALAIMNDDGVGSVNCEYTYDWAFSKNCYLGACGWYVENGLYMYDVNHAKDIMDCWNVNNSELVAESVNCDRCYNCLYCDLCFDSNNCILSSDLKGCSNCAMCVGLRNKQYCILNKQYSKEEYEQELKKLNLENRDSLNANLKKFQELALKYPRKYAYILKSVNSTGFFLIEAKLAKNCFYGFSPIENSAHIVVNDGAKDSYDCNNTGHPELCYECITPDDSTGNKFSIFCWKCTEAEYSNNCHSCVNVFGCSGLKHGSYAILNRRYSKEEFLSLREKIVGEMSKAGEWGEFFSASMSPFAYNESASMDWFPLTQKEATNAGFRWKEGESRNYQATKNSGSLPKDIASTDDSILQDIIACEHGGVCGEMCTSAFKITEQELQLRRRFNMPIPTLCPNCRHYQRLRRRNPPKLLRRSCQCSGKMSSNGVYQNTVSHGHGDQPCPNEFETSYVPDRPEIVYCEACYNAEIV